MQAEHLTLEELLAAARRLKDYAEQHEHTLKVARDAFACAQYVIDGSGVNVTAPLSVGEVHRIERQTGHDLTDAAVEQVYRETAPTRAEVERAIVHGPNAKLVTDFDADTMRAETAKREAEAEDAFEREHAKPSKHAPAHVLKPKAGKHE